MHIVIPMSGTGNRFLEAGYSTPKPLIQIDGKPMIEHVIGLFPGESRFTFICNRDHLAQTGMHALLKGVAPECEIVPIAPHKKGPVFAVAQAFDRIDDDEEVIVNYCDFSKYWDYGDFLRHTRSRGADGAICAYRGFHPHMLGSTNYAFMREKDQWMLEIKEKEPFTQNRMEEFASDGTYYFRRGAYVKKYFRQLMDEGIHIKDEYYVSLVYNLLRRDDLRISIYEIRHMLQWGTPGDLEEYLRWSRYFRRAVLARENIGPQPKSITLIPMAGRGSRFTAERYRTPKPLIEISGNPMILQAACCLPASGKSIFVCLGEHLDGYPLAAAITTAYPNAKIVRIDSVTEGQACTCEIGLKGEDLESPLLIGACDNGMSWDARKYRSLMEDPHVDAVAWSFRHHPSSRRNPQMYGWIKVDGDGTVRGVSVKKPISDDPFNDHAVVGTFYFRKARYFLDALQGMYRKNVRINNEFYVDSCIDELAGNGLNAKVFEIDDYICWGTPDDLRTFEYWQSFFHKCPWHPYALERDVTMDHEKVAEYEARYVKFHTSILSRNA